MEKHLDKIKGATLDKEANLGRSPTKGNGDRRQPNLLSLPLIEKTSGVPQRSAQSFIIPGELPALNEMIEAAKAHYRNYSNIKRVQTKRVAILCRTIKPLSMPVHVVIHWTASNARKDPDNIAAATKFILDGLVTARKLPDDTRKTIKSLTHHFPAPNKQRPQVQVDLFEAK